MLEERAAEKNIQLSATIFTDRELEQDMDPGETENAIEESRRLRQAMQDLASLATLPATWVGRGPEGIARSLTDALFNTLSLDLIYVRLAGVERALIEVIRTRHGSDRAEDEAVRTSVAVLLKAEET